MRKQRQNKDINKILVWGILFSTLFTFFLPQLVQATQSSFIWNANPTEENVTGYKLYFGKKTLCGDDSTCEFDGQSSTKGVSPIVIPDPNQTSYTLDGLDEGTWCFKLTAYKDLLESNYTSTLSKITDPNEICDGIDNDCDGQIDENLTQSCGSDVGACVSGTRTCGNGSWGACVGYVAASTETCDGLDNDCDGTTDEDLVQATTCGVGVCSGNTGEETCSAGAWVGDTCDPLAGATVEICDNLDNDCDGQSDEGCPTCTDNDSDEYFVEGGSCGMIDCNDNDNQINPGATEICDGLDNNCDYQIDEGCPTCTDNDNDEYSVEGGSCGMIDCNDNDNQINPGAAEICDGLDNNCDYQIDEGCPICTDNDNDGYSVEGDSCGMIDCNDNDPTINPGTIEICDGIDNNCDYQIDEGCPTCTDNDNDEYSIEGGSCGMVDCDDNDNQINPDAAEICDGLDNNCDDQIDEGCSTCTDADGDGYYVETGCGTEVDCDDGNPDINPAACDIKRNGIDEDCDGADRRGGPACSGGGDPEICDDGIDNDCDGKTDCADKKDCRNFSGCNRRLANQK